MGFLSEDMRLFREEWGSTGGGGGAGFEGPDDEPADGIRGGTLEKQRTLDRKSHGKVKKTIPMYVGLTTGFCGSFTSFSSFVRDVFLGLSNDLPAPMYHSTESPSTLTHRDAGYSVMAILGVVFVTVALCFCALKAGAHLAAAMDPATPTLPFRLTRRVIDPLFVVLGIGCWIGAVVMARPSAFCVRLRAHRVFDAVLRLTTSQHADPIFPPRHIRVQHVRYSGAGHVVRSPARGDWGCCRW